MIGAAYALGAFFFDPISAYLVNPSGDAATIIVDEVAYFEAEIAKNVNLRLF